MSDMPVRKTLAFVLHLRNRREYWNPRFTLSIIRTPRGFLAAKVSDGLSPSLLVILSYQIMPVEH
jgi:hypothetical protein